MSWVDSRRCLLCQTRGDVATLFRFPPRPEIKKRWAAFCNMDPDLLTNKDCLCINHFTPDQISPRLPTSKKTKLRLTAVPCLMGNGDQMTIPCPTKKITNPRTNDSVVKTIECAKSSHPVPSPTIVSVTSLKDIAPKSKKKKITSPSELPPESALNDLVKSEDEEPSSLVEYEKITVIDLSSPSENAAERRAKKCVRYIGDVTAEHLKSHEDAIKYFFMAKNALENSRKKIRILHRTILRLNKRIKKYEDIIKQNGESKDSLSDDDFSWPLEEDDPMTDSF